MSIIKEVNLLSFDLNIQPTCTQHAVNSLDVRVHIQTEGTWYKACGKVIAKCGTIHVYFLGLIDYNIMPKREIATMNLGPIYFGHPKWPRGISAIPRRATLATP